MQYDFQVSGIPLRDLAPFAGLDERAMAQQGIKRMIADARPGYPCRLSLEDAEVGEEVLLITYEHHKSNSPYRASGPVFFRPNARQAKLGKNELPEMLRHRFLSLRVYNAGGMMVDARTLQGRDLEAALQELLSNPESAYIHVHNAGPGCYNCRIDRIGP